MTLALEDTTLSDLAEVAAGQAAPQGAHNFNERGTPFIRAGSLDALVAGGREEHCERLSDDVAEGHGLRLFPKDTILFAKSGMSATLGRVYRLRAPAYVVSHLAAVIPGRRVDPSFLQRWFEWSPPSRLIPNAAYPSIRLSEIERLEVPIPFPDDPPRSLAEQKRIAAILDKADAIRRRRSEAARLADMLIPGVFYEMFGDPVGNPRKWPKSPLGSLCEIRRGSSPRPIEAFLNGPVPWIKIGDGTKGDLFYIESTEDTITEEGATRSVPVEPGALIVANSGVSLGFARIMKISGCIHDGWLSLSELDSRLNKIFVLLLMNAYTDHLRRIAPSGTQPNLTTSIMKRLEIPVPPRSVQDDFERITMRVQRRVEEAKVQVGKTDEFFNSLVQRAFRGEL